MKLSFDWDLGGFSGSELNKRLLKNAKRASSDALRTLRTEGTRYVRGRKRLKVKEVRKAISLHFPKGEELVWTMRVRPIPVPLAEYPHRQGRRGVNVEITRGRKRLVQSAFVATMRSGHRGVFVRAGKARLPIQELFSSRVRDVFDDSGMVESLFDVAASKWQSTFQRLNAL